ncbi:SMG7-like isoform X1 [Brachionus plicatilis]|uniref:SMG7-like isoform X1 n=1 Tax=Brachionus plicatilis TaxID=10195 RepID=A0A3M7QX88_BRAPC|nr:SMG7-like isoform X1 [Brachionus plicatilis]
MSNLIDKRSTELDDPLETKVAKQALDVQVLFNKIESIKSTVSLTNADRSEFWIQRQNLLDLYQQIILNDLEFTIDKRLEQELWNLVFKNQINYFQSQIKDTSSKTKISNSHKKLEVQANLSFFLEAARGFYTKLLDDLAKKYALNEKRKDNSCINVSFYQRFPSLFDQMSLDPGATMEPTREKQILYLCQHTLTHLGDIARYAFQFQEAKNYYLHAIKLVPYLGHPYNQLGILFETSRTNQLSAVFYYIRSIATRCTFPLASTNLENFFHKIIDTQMSRYQAQLSQKDLLNLFLQINAIVHSLETGKNSKSLNSNCARLSNFFDLFKSSFVYFTSSPGFQKLDWSQLCQIVSIVIFHMSQSATTLVQSDAKMKENFDFAAQTALDLFLFFLHQFILIYAKNEALKNLVLPSIYLSANFIRNFKNGHLVKQNLLFAYNENTQGNFECVLNFLNGLSAEIPDQDLDESGDYPLCEDRMLDGFVPLREAHAHLNFKKYVSNSQLMSEDEEKVLRKFRIISLFESLAESADCYLRVNGGALKFSSKENYPFRENKPEQPRRRRQNVALSSMAAEMDKKVPVQENVFTNRVVNQAFPSFSSPSAARQNAGGDFFPSAFSRQFAPQNRMPVNNGFPSFLPNENSSNANLRNFTMQQDLSTDLESKAMNNEAHLSNLLIQQLMNSTRNETIGNPMEQNFNMANYMQNSMPDFSNSIWSYPKAPGQK